MRLGTVLPALLVACGTNYDKVLALTGDPVAGEFLYQGYCESCHAADGTGLSGPDLTERLPTLTSPEILEQIEVGGNGMPAFEGEFTDQELADLLEFLTLTFR